MSTAVIHPAQPEKILKGLTKVWTSLGQEEKQQGKPTVLRACAMTLIVATDEADGGFLASQTISELMHEHPSRGIVLAVSDKAEQDLEARVLAQCWKPFGKAQQICCEQIEITAHPESWPSIGPIVIGIIAADLPVVLWCRHGAAFSPSATQQQRDGLEAVTSLATKIIVDTANAEPVRAFRVLDEWRAKGRVVADLEWTRLTPWREPIAQIFDNSLRENKLSSFHTVEIVHTDERPTSSVLYMGAWLAGFSHAKLVFSKTSGYGPGLHRVTLHSPFERIDFERTGRDCMTLRSTNGRERKYSFSEPSLYPLMNEELAILGPDSAFDVAFHRAQELTRE